MLSADQSRENRGRIREIKDAMRILRQEISVTSGEQLNVLNQELTALRKEKEELYRQQSRN